MAAASNRGTYIRKSRSGKRGAPLGELPRGLSGMKPANESEQSPVALGQTPNVEVRPVRFQEGGGYRSPTLLAFTLSMNEHCLHSAESIGYTDPFTWFPLLLIGTIATN